ncbi:MAG TPA: HEAT repeat domain-containing protein, partial [Acidobacteriota bacterium]|nr:HEAT repeat domain-containing protein [Acidobacteriota bacterium]
MEQLPESLDLKNLRARARGLRYAGSRLSELRINQLADRMMEFVRGGIKREETPYQGCVLYSFSRAGNRVKQIFIQKLLRLVRDKDWTVRKNAARALGELGVESEPMVTALLGLLRDKAKKRLIPKLRSWVVTALIGLLRDKESYVQSTADWALGQFGVGS